jgi:hypothetical protein
MDGDGNGCIDGICQTQAEMCGLPVAKSAGGALCAVIGGFLAWIAQQVTELRELLGGYCLHNALQLRI